jgi:flavin reductase (DIM6/NTAB) family NADH-FMN oxidoreductase RutF
MSSKGSPAGAETKLDASLYRRTCALFATGITVITTVDSNGHPHGMTVNSFSSVSLDPPLILVCIDLKNAILGHFLTSAWFAVNILSDDQEDVSRRFSSAAERRFQGMDWKPGDSGVPLISGSLALMECELTKTFEAGDHAVLIGEVRRASYREGNPLVYFGSAYRNLASAGTMEL